METLSLDGAWEFRRVGDADWLPARVPGCNFTDLMACEKIPDPFVGDNEQKVRWVIESDWEYRRTFVVGAPLLGCDRVFLECDGLDTLAAIRINGHKVGETDNMFRSCRFDVKKLMRNGKNEIAVLFSSPTVSVRRHLKKQGVRAMGCSLPEAPLVRKVQSQYGWDWGPQLPPCGIWRSIRLVGYSAARIQDVHLRQKHRGMNITVSATVEIERCGREPLRVRLVLEHPGGRRQEAEAALVARRDRAVVQLVVGKPQLWWPNGYGHQPLYTARVEVRTDEGLVLDQNEKRLGLRRIQLRRRRDRTGESFSFVVNGVPIFAKGANWIPADSFPTRLGEERYRYLLESAADAHMNMLRVWGGGFYEDEVFYDLCDELGLLVWQDFMFACGVYPVGKEFLGNVRGEVTENVRRLRGRTCLALWCGNNEMEQGWAEWGWTARFSKQARDGYRKLFHKLMPEWVGAGDPDTEYWPSSPHSGKTFSEPNSESTGDGHYWGVWHGRKPFAEYREHTFRFMSEFGFQSLPAIETVEAFAPEGQRNMTSYVMERHQKNGAGNGVIVQYLTNTFRLPKDFDNLCYLSQVLQAEALRYGVEHWRRNRDRVGGTLYWQLNDCWPAVSWSGIDYFGRWKALHYAAKRFYAPVLLSAEEEGARVVLHVTNDTREVFKGIVHWRLETLDGGLLMEKRVRASIDPGRSLRAVELDFSGSLGGDDLRKTVLVYELLDGPDTLASGIVTFAPDKHLELENPGLVWQALEIGNLWAVKLSAQRLARFVRIGLKGADAVWTDNYFDLPAGVERTVACDRLDGMDLNGFRSALRIRSLWESW